MAAAVLGGIAGFYLAAGLPPVLAAALLANSVHFSFCFWLAHRALRPAVEWVLSRTNYRVPQVRPENEMTVTVLTRVTPGPPLFLQSYLLGLSGVRFRTYMWVSIAVQGLLGSAYIVFVTA